jgi:hypothetical protein
MNDASAWAPTIYDLRHPPDAARFGLIWRESAMIRAKCNPARGGQRIEAIGLHIQWGHTAGSLRHWLGVAASATVMVQQDGSILRVIPEEHGPWTQGDVQQPDARAGALLQRFGPDPNVYSLTIEAEDARSERINPAQERAICWQIRQWQRAYPQLAGADWEERIVGHYEINSVEKATCGRYRDAIVASLRANPEMASSAPRAASEFPGLPSWLPDAALRAAFPLADPAGAITRRVIELAASSGVIPWFIAKVDLAPGANLWRFDRFTLLNDGHRVWREGEDAHFNRKEQP